MSRLPSASVSQLLAKWRAGDEEALRDLVPLIYEELHRLAHRYLQRERPDHTLQSTALVHEAYLRFRKQKQVEFQNRAHFFAASAQLMRQILVDYARSHRAGKRGGGYKLSIEEAPWLCEERGADLVQLDDALKGLAKLDPQQCRIVELRFFGGLSIEETAEILSISAATVKRDWATARLWLSREMKRTAQT